MFGTKSMTTILTFALVLAAATALAGDLPVQAERIWAPTGDLIGLDNHATGTFQALDRHGDEAKAAEDWQLLGKYSGAGILGWHKTWDSGYAMSVRGYGNSQSGGVNGRYSLEGSAPGTFGWFLDFRNGRNHYDTDSEMRAPGFKAVEPPTLAEPPRQNWRMTDFGLGWRANDAFSLTASYDRMCRDGAKGSLGRGIWGNGVPGTKAYDTTRNGFLLAGHMAAGAFAMDLDFGYRTYDGDRATVSHFSDRTNQDDQKLWRLGLDLGWDINPGTKLFGGAMTANLKNEGKSVFDVAATNSDSESKTTGGRLGVATRFGQATSFRLTGNYHKLDTDAREQDGDAQLQRADRERTRTEMRAVLANTSLKRTRLQLDYRYRKSDRDEQTAVATGGLLQDVKQDREQHDLDFKGRYRFNRKALLKFGLGWQKLDVEQTTTGDAIFWTMGDRKRDRLDWELKLQTRPHAKFTMDLGYQGLDQKFERVDMEGIETAWKTHRGFLNLNWRAHPRIVIYGTVSGGSEEYALNQDPEPRGTMGAVAYEGTTVRYLPGLTLTISQKLMLDAMYEGIRFEDKGNESDALQAVKSDHDRSLVRLRWAAREKMTVAATYQRREFFEHRWDNYIQDVWQLSVSGLF